VRCTICCLCVGQVSGNFVLFFGVFFVFLGFGGCVVREVWGDQWCLMCIRVLGEGL